MPPESQAHSSKKELIAFVACWILSIVGVVFGYVHNLTVLQVACSLPTFLMAGVCLHELGHAMAARALGIHVKHIQLGKIYTNQEPLKFRLLGFNWHLYSVPFSGALHFSQYSKRGYRSKRCAIIAAGPLINFLAIVPCVLFWPQSGPLTSFSFLLLSWGFVNGYLLVHSLSPIRLYYLGKAPQNDVRLFWKTLFYADQEIQGFVDLDSVAREYAKGSESVDKLTAPEALAIYQANPARRAYLGYAVHLMSEASDPQCAPYVRQLIEHPDTPKEHIALILDHYLTRQLDIGVSSDPGLSDELSLRLLAEEDSLSTRGTRACILIDLGKIEEGKAMLHSILEKTDSRIDKCYSNIFLALVAKQQGDLALARQYAKTASQTDSTCAALKRIADLLD